MEKNTILVEGKRGRMEKRRKTGEWGRPYRFLSSVFSVPIIIVIARLWFELLKARSNNELKQSMIERGMSVEEIERVINVGSKPDRKWTRAARR